MTNIQQLVLIKMQALSTDQQQSVLQFVQEFSNSKSEKQLEEQILEGLDSLERGEGIEATEEWWEKERNFQTVIVSYCHDTSSSFLEFLQYCMDVYEDVLLHDSLDIKV
jgi:hypothetical protein